MGVEGRNESVVPDSILTVEDFVDRFCSDILDRVVQDEQERLENEEREMRGFVDSLCSNILDRVVQTEKEMRGNEEREMRDFARTYCQGIIETAVQMEAERRDLEAQIISYVGRITKSMGDNRAFGDCPGLDKDEDRKKTADNDGNVITMEGMPDQGFQEKSLPIENEAGSMVAHTAVTDGHVPENKDMSSATLSFRTQLQSNDITPTPTRPIRRPKAEKNNRGPRTIMDALAKVLPVSTLMVPRAAGHVVPQLTVSRALTGVTPLAGMMEPNIIELKEKSVSVGILNSSEAAQTVDRGHTCLQFDSSKSANGMAPIPSTAVPDINSLKSESISGQFLIDPEAEILSDRGSRSAKATGRKAPFYTVCNALAGVTGLAAVVVPNMIGVQSESVNDESFQTQTSKVDNRETGREKKAGRGNPQYSGSGALAGLLPLTTVIVPQGIQADSKCGQEPLEPFRTSQIATRVKTFKLFWTQKKKSDINLQITMTKMDEDVLKTAAENDEGPRISGQETTKLTATNSNGQIKKSCKKTVFKQRLLKICSCIGRQARDYDNL